MTAALLVAVVASLGVHLLSGAVLYGRHELPLPRRAGQAAARRSEEWLTQAGFAHVPRSAVAVVVGGAGLLGATVAWLIFGGPIPALVAGVFSATIPVTSFRRRRRTRLAVAQEAWPRMIEELRVLTSSAGRSVPQALFEVGARAPLELRPSFSSARRTWTLTTDFDRTLHVLKSQLADPTCDATCETLLIAHELGGADLDRRLEALADDRRVDATSRKDALARQAGVRFSRRFVLLVPLGMALAGLTVGSGREAYQTGFGQVLVVAGLAMVIACWAWAGHIMRLPDDRRVFTA